MDDKDTIFPPSLKHGDLVAVIAPSQGYSKIDGARQRASMSFLEKMGLKIKLLGVDHPEDDMGSQCAKDRAADLNFAFGSKKIKGIFSLIGGYSSIQLLHLIDYDCIKNNPKIFCGYSDISTLSLAIYTKTGLVTYSGPHFSTWSLPQELSYIQDNFEKCCFTKSPYEVLPSQKWFDCKWYDATRKIDTVKNTGPIVLSSGQASGKLLGGHLRSINSLQGTGYFPKLANAILFLEEDFETSPDLFYRNLTSLSLIKGFESIRGILIGRFQKKSKMNKKILSNILLQILPKNIPVVIDLDFGHTMPITTLPIGGEVTLSANIHTQERSILVVKH